jgi:gamma-glutamylputrescine oxidase
MAWRWEEDVDENRSVWMAHKPPYTPAPELTADTTADVVIVGGGFTGMSTAYHLARRFPDKRIVLLEARALANGASGRNGGLMLNWINGVHSPDTEHAKMIFDTTKSGIDLIVDIIRENGMKVSYQRTGCLELYTKPERADAAAKEAEGFRAAGIPLEFLSGTALTRRLRAEGVAGALYDPTAGQLDGVEYLRALRPVVEKLGVVIHEGTPVLRIDEGATITVHTPRATVTAKALVLATNAYTGLLGYFKRYLFALHSHVMATRPMAVEERAVAGWGGAAGFSDDLDYGSLTSRGEVVFGGGGNAAYGYRFGGRTSFPGDTSKSFRFIEKRLAQYLPELGKVDVAHRWSGAVCLTMTRVCAMGVRGEHRNVFYAFGYSGHGIALANLAGRVLTDIYSDDDEKWRGLPFYMPRLYPIPPEPFRWLGYHVVTKLTGKSPRRQH